MPENALDDWQVHFVGGKEGRQAMPEVVPPKPPAVTLRNDTRPHRGRTKVVLRCNTCRAWNFSLRPFRGEDPVIVGGIAGLLTPIRQNIAEYGMHDHGSHASRSLARCHFPFRPTTFDIDLAVLPI